MFIVTLDDSWDRTVGLWQVQTEKEAEELEEYIKKKIEDLDLEFQFSSCEILDGIEEGNKETIDEFFEDVLEDNREEAEERKERDKNYVSPLNGVIDKFDTTKVTDFSGMFKECK